MKYLITEEQSIEINQSKFNQGPLGFAIIQVMDMYDLPWAEKYVVMYLEDNDYLMILWSSRGAVSSEMERKIANYIEQFVPVNLSVTVIS
jgi:hypothetical protein